MYILGVDQTGAVVQSTFHPKPLSAALISFNGSKRYLSQPQFLKALLPKYVTQLIAKEPYNLWVLMDCVLGLPYKLTTKVDSRFFIEVRNFVTQYGYGLTPSIQFLSKIFQSQLGFNINFKDPKQQPFFKRKVEIKAGSNSVFQLHPFQKNIGCGSYRIWSELAHWDPNDYMIWPDRGSEKSHIVFAEVYPSYIWKHYIKSKRGDCEALKHWLKELGVNHSIDWSCVTLDQLDAIVSASIGVWYCQRGMSLPRSLSEYSKQLILERWILGVPL